jgi:hypothetical protein
MMKVGGVSVEECKAFITDLTLASANAHEGQEYGESPLYPDAVNERVERVMKDVLERITQLPE